MSGTVFAIGLIGIISLAAIGMVGAVIDNIRGSMRLDRWKQEDWQRKRQERELANRLPDHWACEGGGEV